MERYFRNDRLLPRATADGRGRRGGWRLSLRGVSWKEGAFGTRGVQGGRYGFVASTYQVGAGVARYSGNTVRQASGDTPGAPLRSTS